MVSPSRSLSAGSLMLALLASPVAATSYSLVENWQGKNFLDYFNFHVGSDPTNGFVNYLDKESAERAGLVKLTDSGSVYLGVDHVTKLDPHGKKGRDSVRIGSKKYYDKSLVIADIAHMPGSVCGTWPAFWSVGKEWPQDGEIDIIEGVNLQDHNEIVMHTAGTCSLTDTDMTGIVNATGCGTDLGTVGCVIEGHQGSYGTSFNKQQGGVYALEWTADFLKIWYFPRHAIPPSITSGKPDVTKFGTPMALVEESCDVASAFKAQSFVFDVTFCGDWAGGVFGNSGCPMTDADSFQSCHNYVANHPAEYKETYWEINSVKVYQVGVKGIASPASSESEPVQPKHTKTDAAPVVANSHTETQPHTHAQTHTEAPVETHATHTATVHSVSSNEDGTAAIIQGMSPTISHGPAATAENSNTEATEVHRPKKTRTVTSFVTETQTICPEAERSSLHAVPTSAEPIVPAPTHTHVAKEHTSVAPVATPSGVDAVPAPTEQAKVHSNPPGPVATHGAAVPTAAAAEEFGATWAEPDATPTAFSVTSRTSKALIPAPSGVSPESATSASSGVSVTSASPFGPVFTGAADRSSLSISALFFGFFVAVLV
ncbi:Concanavalin A-like lectin/glucanase subgroup [Penicillium sp. DV-2018c]|nr:Concanavalin A-like lectin/glucanase subgroup [Penicillium sp. DV-2018c]